MRPETKNAPAQITNKTPSANREYLAPGEDPDNHLFLPVMKHMAADQKDFWTRPAHFQVKDLRWAAPLAGFTAALIASDSWISKQVPDKPNQLLRSKHISNYAAYSLVGLGASSFVFGHLTSNDHLAETGLLSGEAAIDSTVAAYLMKEATQRSRPYQDNGNGKFFQGGSSFPSEHSAVAWSVASIWAHEYPSKLSQTLAYGLASAVTLTRVTSQQHFASDAFLGSLMGWYFGRQVYRARHDVELGGSGWGSLLPDSQPDHPRNPENMGSPYVPVDSWVYPLFDRMAALGYMHSGYAGMRPWTRMECARLVEEIGESLESEGEANSNAQQMYDSLAEEFAPETGRLDGAKNLGASLDSVYTRSTVISGTPLRDGYHFGQTIINDYGRPYGEGYNNVTGVTAHAVAGPFSISVQAEYQHAPAVASDPQSVLQATASADNTLPLANGTSEINRLRLLESSVAFTYRNVEFSIGKQSLWLGPEQAGPFLFSNNAEPIDMFRIDSVSPYRIPFLSRIFGAMRSEYFIGRLSGQHWEFSPPLLGPVLPSQPFVEGAKLSFRPTGNLEFGFDFTAQFGGTGNPFTWSNLLKTFYYHKGPNGSCCNPAKRLSAFDFSYRVPGLRNWLQIYTDSMVIDEYSPIGSDRPSINPGIYLPQIPGIHNLEIRVEGMTTDLNIPTHFGNGAVYYDERYHSGYTNNGYLLGNWVGREGRGEQGWLTYRFFSSRDNVQLEYRHNNVDKTFLQGGGYQEFRVNGNVTFGHGLELNGSVQYETWNFPVLASTTKNDVTTSVQLTFWPRSKN